MAVPDGVAESGAGGADVGVRVVPIHAPGLEHAVHVALVAGAPDVVGHFVLASFLQGAADASGDVVEHSIPGDALPLAFAAFAGTLERVQDSVGVGDLVDRGRAFGAVSPAGSGVVGVALELAHAAGGLVHVGQQAAGGFAVETGGGHHVVGFFLAARPGLGFILRPVVPALGGRVVCEGAAGLEAFERLLALVEFGDESDGFGEFFDDACHVERGVSGAGFEAVKLWKCFSGSSCGGFQIHGRGTEFFFVRRLAVKYWRGTFRT